SPHSLRGLFFGLDCRLGFFQSSLQVGLKLFGPLVLGDQLKHQLERGHLFLRRLRPAVFFFRLRILRRQIGHHESRLRAEERRVKSFTVEIVADRNGSHLTGITFHFSLFGSDFAFPGAWSPELVAWFNWAMFASKAATSVCMDWTISSTSGRVNPEERMWPK